MGCRIKSYRHRSSYNPGNIGILYENEPFGCIKNIIIASNISNHYYNRGVFVSWFENTLSDGKTRNYIALVNEDPENSITIRVYVDGEVLPGFITRNTIQNSDLAQQLEMNQFKSIAKTEIPEMYTDFHIEAGDMAVVYWDRAKNYPIPAID